jgi:hypothetical protein
METFLCFFLSTYLFLKRRINKEEKFKKERKKKGVEKARRKHKHKDLKQREREREREIVPNPLARY